MISKDTASRIWECHREIAVAERLLVDIAEAKDSDDPHAGTLRDVFGRRRNFQLGIPSGESGHRLFNVSPTLAQSIIRAHIANKQAELAEANEQARIELSTKPRN